MTMEGLRKLKKAELLKLIKHSGLPTTGTKKKLLSNIRSTYEKVKGIVHEQDAESAQSNQSPSEVYSGLSEEPQDEV